MKYLLLITLLTLSGCESIRTSLKGVEGIQLKLAAVGIPILDASIGIQTKENKETTPPK